MDLEKIKEKAGPLIYIGTCSFLSLVLLLVCIRLALIYWIDIES